MGMMVMSDNNAGKGSSPRPFSVPKEVFELRLTLVWGTAEEKAEARKRLIQMGEINDEVQ
jgi:hypothetical protein